MKNKKIIMLLACLILVIIGSGTYAAIITSSDTVEDVTTPSLDIELVQTSKMENSQAIVEDDGTLGFDYGSITPGTVIDESMAVKVDESSKPAYVRVTVTRYWQKDGIKDVDGNIDPASIELKAGSDEWLMVEDEDDNEVVYFYYLKPLNSGETSSSLVEGFEIVSDLNENSNKYSGYSSHIDFFAEGVQIVAAEDAILAEWGVEATINDNNEITSIIVQ